jgi:hypothetical protein
MTKASGVKMSPDPWPLTSLSITRPSGRGGIARPETLTRTTAGAARSTAAVTAFEYASRS